MRTTPSRQSSGENGVFKISNYPLESLEAELDLADFAIAVASADDKTVSCGRRYSTPRDNVTFEADSTVLVDGYKWWFSAEIYKSYLYCAARIIRSEGGVITAYDGDRVMAVFIGDSKNSNAAKTALKIHYAASNIINPVLKKKYPKSSYSVGHVVGIDTSEVHVARTGIRGSNDLVWIGRAANYAAKLSARPETYRTYVTKEVYKKLNKESKLSSGTDMWTPVTWSEFDNRTIYGSNYSWTIT